MWQNDINYATTAVDALKVFFFLKQFLEFYLYYGLLEALLRQEVKPNHLLVCS